MDVSNDEELYDDAISTRYVSAIDAETCGVDVSQPFSTGENLERTHDIDYRSAGSNISMTLPAGMSLHKEGTFSETGDCAIKQKTNSNADNDLKGNRINEWQAVRMEAPETELGTELSLNEAQIYSFAKDLEPDFGNDDKPEFTIDFHGYCHKVNKSNIPTEASQQDKLDLKEKKSKVGDPKLQSVRDIARKLEPEINVNPTDPRSAHEHYSSLVNNQSQNLTSEFEENIYDIVPSALSRNSSLLSQASGTYAVIRDLEQPEVRQSQEAKLKGKKSSRKKSADGTYDWKRRKEKSKALKRSSKLEMPQLDQGPPDTSSFFILPTDQDSDTYFTDSSFDSTLSSAESADEISYTTKPLPPEPKHKKKDLKKNKLVPMGSETAAEDESVLKPVKFRRERPAPTLPEGPQDLTNSQIKLRGVLQSLVDSETGYINSLDRLTNEYQDPIVNQFGLRKTEVKMTFSKIKDILQIHRMFQIELAEKLSKWNDSESIGHIFLMFSQHMVIDLYSEYVNNYEAASEMIKECENSKQAFKEFLKNKQMSSQDRLSLQGLMLKPIQRFPQFIMIIKDLLKNTPRDHHDREPLQEALTGIENVAHQLNERKRESEQQHRGQIIISKLSPRLQCEKNVCLIRQDDMEQITQDQTGSPAMKQRRLYLMKDRLVSVHVSARDSENGERLTYKWHSPLQHMELTTSAITPNMQTKVQRESTNSTTILSPKMDEGKDDPFNVASQLTDMMHDISVLAQISQLVASLKFTYPGLTEDNLHETVTKLQKDIQGKDYQLQMLNSSTIILQDTLRRKKYVFSAANANVKQEWCIDFLMAKYALDPVNILSWYKQDAETQLNQPALLMKHMSVDMQRTFTRVKCATKVYFPTKTEGSVEHLWVCSSTDQVGQVSLVSLHTAKPALVESFQATTSEILCVEMVERFGDSEDESIFKDDTVWMSTAEAKILVFMMCESQPGSHRRPVYTFEPGCRILSMLYVEDQMFCGSKSGLVVVYSRDFDGAWSQSSKLTLGNGPVTSLLCVGEHLWAACGTKIFIFDVEKQMAQGIIDKQTTADPDVRIQYLVKTGVGVWVSYMGQPNISLFHSESKKLLQDFSICKAVNELLFAYPENKNNCKNFYVTSLMASLGLLWVGTNIGVILTYPLPRLRDGVPRINNSPSVALHGHNGPVKFLVPVQYGPVTGNPIRRSSSSILRKSGANSIVNTLPPLDEKTKSVELKAEAEHAVCDKEFGYERIRRMAGSPQLYDKCHPSSSETATYNPDTNNKLSEDNVFQESEHKYFILEKVKREDDEDTKTVQKPDIGISGQDAQPLMRPKNLRMNPDGGGINGETDTRNKRLTRIDIDQKLPAMGQISFRSELRNKVRSRISCDDLIDRDINKEQVDQLYPTLLRANLSDIREKSDGYQTLPTILSSEQESDSTHSKTLSLTPQEHVKKSNTFSFMKSRKSLDKEKETGKKSQSPARKVDISPDTKQPSANQNRTGLNRKSSIGSSFSSGSTIDTMRKQDSNTIMVLSGGDGYLDWKKGTNLQSYRPEEPILLFWMYRF